jgi:hypothetical protein
MLLLNAYVGRRLFSSALAQGLLVYVYEVVAIELAWLRWRDVVAASENLVMLPFILLRLLTVYSYGAHLSYDGGCVTFWV